MISLYPLWQLLPPCKPDGVREAAEGEAMAGVVVLGAGDTRVAGETLIRRGTVTKYPFVTRREGERDAQCVVLR